MISPAKFAHFFPRQIMQSNWKQKSHVLYGHMKRTFGLGVLQLCFQWLARCWLHSLWHNCFCCIWLNAIVFGLDIFRRTWIRGVTEKEWNKNSSKNNKNYIFVDRQHEPNNKNRFDKHISLAIIEMRVAFDNYCSLFMYVANHIPKSYMPSRMACTPNKILIKFVIGMNATFNLWWVFFYFHALTKNNYPKYWFLIFIACNRGAGAIWLKVAGCNF